jgi:hypothetical protein
MHAVFYSLLKLVACLVVVASRFEVDKDGFSKVLAQVASSLMWPARLWGTY